MPGLLIIILVLILLFNPELLPRMGDWLGGQSRKPLRQAKWMWSSFTGTEDESIRAERDYGQECARAFAKQFSNSGSRTDQEFVANIGARLADAVRDPRRKFHFTVVGSTLANAFALPGGFIFITGSLLDLCEHDRNEIAFFLGHEIGHVLRGHAKDHLTANVFLNAVTARLPAAGQMLRQVISKGYSRTLELEADQEAARLAAAAGFDARASILALNRLAQVSPDASGLAEYLSSHPPISERVRGLGKYLRLD
ncbi:MAG TPA: M48 family metallopeptidase [Acidobacteriota bacterium]|nr:M48 family metallopeptidase [Acidobacteriota bacterium]